MGIILFSKEDLAYRDAVSLLFTPHAFPPLPVADPGEAMLFKSSSHDSRRQRSIHTTTETVQVRKMSLIVVITRPMQMNISSQLLHETLAQWNLSEWVVVSELEFLKQINLLLILLRSNTEISVIVYTDPQWMCDLYNPSLHPSEISQRVFHTVNSFMKSSHCCRLFSTQCDLLTARRRKLKLPITIVVNVQHLWYLRSWRSCWLAMSGKSRVTFT